MRDLVCSAAVASRIETARTFLTASGIDSLVGDYLAGVAIEELAERYGHARSGLPLRRGLEHRRRCGNLSAAGRVTVVLLVGACGRWTVGLFLHGVR